MANKAQGSDTNAKPLKQKNQSNTKPQNNKNLINHNLKEKVVGSPGSGTNHQHNNDSVPVSKCSGQSSSGKPSQIKITNSQKSHKQQCDSSRSSGKPSSTNSTKNSQVHKKFKKKPWQKYNARTPNNGERSCSSSDTEDEEKAKYKKREIVDNSSKFEEPELNLPGIQDSNDEDADDFDELCEKMRNHEKNKEPTEIKNTKGQLPESVVLPEDFERDLDQILSLNVPGQQVDGLLRDEGYDDPQSFLKWLEKC